MVVDDFHHSLFPGVNEGCHRFLLYATRRLIPFAVGKNKLFLTAHSHHEAYVATLKELLQPPAGMGVVLHGFPAVCVDAPMLTPVPPGRGPTAVGRRRGPR